LDKGALDGSGNHSRISGKRCISAGTAIAAVPSSFRQGIPALN
jgi:hypothetical protein